MGWDVVYKVSPHGKVPIPNNEDYNIDPNTYDGEFFQEDGLEGHFEIDLTGVIEMEVHDDEIVDDEDADEEVRNAKDLELLERLPLGDHNENYNIDPNTYDGEFFQEDGLEGHFEIDLTRVIEMEVHDDEMVDDEDDVDEEVRNAKDLELLERLQLGDDNEDEIPPLEHGLELLDLRDSDDETYDPANPDEDDYF